MDFDTMPALDLLAAGIATILDAYAAEKVAAAVEEERERILSPLLAFMDGKAFRTTVNGEPGEVMFTNAADLVQWISSNVAIRERTR